GDPAAHAPRRRPDAGLERPHPRPPARALRLQAGDGAAVVDRDLAARRGRHAALLDASGVDAVDPGSDSGAHRGRLAGAARRGAAGRTGGVSPPPAAQARPRVVVAFGTRPEAN